MRHKFKNKAAQHTQPNGNIRIIAGQHRGRKLPVLTSDGLRPTTDRTKETLFNWLQMHIAGAHCIDAFSGSGSLAFEALSRGAASVTAIEKNGPAARQLKTNAQTLQATNLTVINKDCLLCQTSDFTQLTSASTERTKQANIVFIDPPFKQNLVFTSIVRLLQLGVIDNEALWYCETETDLVMQHPTLRITQVKQHSTRGFQYGLYTIQLNT